MAPDMDDTPTKLEGIHELAADFESPPESRAGSRSAPSATDRAGGSSASSPRVSKVSGHSITSFSQIDVEDCMADDWIVEEPHSPTMVERCTTGWALANDTANVMTRAWDQEDREKHEKDGSVLQSLGSEVEKMVVAHERRRSLVEDTEAPVHVDVGLDLIQNMLSGLKDKRFAHDKYIFEKVFRPQAPDYPPPTAPKAERAMVIGAPAKAKQGPRRTSIRAMMGAKLA